MHLNKDNIIMFISYKEYEFKDIIDFLRLGFPVRRKKWKEQEFIYLENNTKIETKDLYKFYSIPYLVKEHLMNRGGDIEYKNNVMYVNDNRNISQWNVQLEDIFARDWEIINVEIGY